MRHCHTKMLEDAYLNLPGTLTNITVQSNRGRFGPFDSFPLKAAVCPNCGEASVYIKDDQDYAEKANKGYF